jgi:hypothetical protein
MLPNWHFRSKAIRWDCVRGMSPVDASSRKAYDGDHMKAFLKTQADSNGHLL